MKTAYDELNTTIKALEYRSEKQNDIVLERKKDELVRKYRKLIGKATSFSEKQKLEMRIQKILQSYELVKTESLRKEYNKEIERIQKQQDENIRKQRNKEKYSHEKDFMEDLIYSQKDRKVRMIGKKKNPSPIERKLVRSNGEEISFSETAVIGYKNWEALYSYIYEYKVKRIVEGIEKSDTIYTELSIFDLSTDEKTGEKVNPEYYNCVVNNLLTEEKIEGAQYNGGYIGSIQKDNEGNNYTTIDEKEYLGEDKENLAAIMILKQIREKEEKQREGEEK